MLRIKASNSKLTYIKRLVFIVYWIFLQRTNNIPFIFWPLNIQHLKTSIFFCCATFHTHAIWDGIAGPCCQALWLWLQIKASLYGRNRRIHMYMSFCRIAPYIINILLSWTTKHERHIIHPKEKKNKMHNTIYYSIFSYLQVGFHNWFF